CGRRPCRGVATGTQRRKLLDRRDRLRGNRGGHHRGRRQPGDPTLRAGPKALQDGGKAMSRQTPVAEKAQQDTAAPNGPRRDPRLLSLADSPCVWWHVINRYLSSDKFGEAQEV